MRAIGCTISLIALVLCGMGCDKPTANGHGGAAAVTSNGTSPERAPTARAQPSPSDGQAPAVTKDEPSAKTAGSAPAASPAARPAAGATKAGAVAVVTTEAEANAAVGGRVRLTGMAEDAKIAGVVVQGDLTVYCLDRRFGWSDRVGTEVTVEGELALTEQFKAKKMPNGAIRPGTSGAVFAIRTCAVQ